MDRKIIIRKANCDDYSDIKKCIQESFVKYIDRIGMKPEPMLQDFSEYIKGGNVFVLKYENRFGGVIVLIPRADYVYLDTVAVYPAFQGESLGKHLLRFADRFTLENGTNEIRLCTNEKMYENIAIYTHYGYKEYARGIEKGYHRVYLKKELPFDCQEDL